LGSNPYSKRFPQFFRIGTFTALLHSWGFKMLLLLNILLTKGLLSPSLGGNAILITWGLYFRPNPMFSRKKFPPPILLELNQFSKRFCFLFPFFCPHSFLSLEDIILVQFPVCSVVFPPFSLAWSPGLGLFNRVLPFWAYSPEYSFLQGLLGILSARAQKFFSIRSFPPR